MSGVFGCATARHTPVAGHLQRMADSLRLQAWHRTQTWADDSAGVGLGQANIGIVASDPQPLHTEDGKLSLVFFGELYHTESLRRQLHAPLTDAELVLRLYRSQGERFLQSLEGVFVLALWDAARRQVLLANDRFGLLPTYYASRDGRLTFAPQVKAILTDPDFGRRLDMTALAQFMRFQRLLGDRTFFEELHLLPYGSLLTFDVGAGNLSVAHYWDFDRIPSRSDGVTFEDAVAETGRLLRRAVEARVQGSEHLGVYLSGGLDSRTLAGFASQIHPPITTITYGVPGCRDAYYAERIARRLDSHHHYFALADGRWLPDHVDTHLQITEGFTTWTHSHASVTLRPARELVDVNLTGYGGDQILGGRGLQRAHTVVAAPDELAFNCRAFYCFNQRFSWPGITEIEERYLYTPAVYAEVAGRAFDSMRQDLDPYKRFPYSQAWDYITTIFQGTRLSNLNVVYQRAFFEARYPFYDYSLYDWVCSLPADFRLDDRLYLAVINRQIPKVTWVPRDTDEQLLTHHRLIRQTHGLWQKVRSHLSRRQLRTLHEDPEGWLRNDLREWAAALLFDPRTSERGIFNPAFLRSIFDRHMLGAEIHTIGKIAPIITYEMMLRRFYDEPEESPL